MSACRNVGVNFAADAPDNPLNIVRRIFRKGDYVAIKLDIDNAPIEQVIVLFSSILNFALASGQYVAYRPG